MMDSRFAWDAMILCVAVEFAPGKKKAETANKPRLNMNNLRLQVEEAVVELLRCRVISRSKLKMEIMPFTAWGLGSPLHDLEELVRRCLVTLPKRYGAIRADD